MPYKLIAGGPYKQNNGTNCTETSTNNVGGAAKNIGDSADMATVPPPEGANAPHLIPGQDGITAADWITVSDGEITSDASYPGLAVCLLLNHGLSVGHVISFPSAAYNNAYRVVAVMDADAFVFNAAFISGEGPINVLKARGTVGEIEPGNYSVQKLRSNVHSIATGNLETGASDYGRPRINYMKTVRSNNKRSLYNFWDRATATWLVEPTFYDDFHNFAVNGTEPDDSRQEYGGHLRNEFAVSTASGPITGVI